jgi:hypothetical protein
VIEAWDLPNVLCCRGILDTVFCTLDELETRLRMTMYSAACPNAIRDNFGETFGRR